MRRKEDYLLELFIMVVLLGVLVPLPEMEVKATCPESSMQKAFPFMMENGQPSSS